MKSWLLNLVCIVLCHECQMSLVQILHVIGHRCLKGHGWVSHWLKVWWVLFLVSWVWLCYLYYVVKCVCAIQSLCHYVIMSSAHCVQIVCVICTLCANCVCHLHIVCKLCVSFLSMLVIVSVIFVMSICQYVVWPLHAMSSCPISYGHCHAMVN